jgi:hypothetical protein
VKFESKQRIPTNRKIPDSQAEAEATPPGNWRSFPNFEKLLNVPNPPLVARLEATCRQLENIVSSGSPQERSRARAVMTAYVRTLELYRTFANGVATDSSHPGNQSPGPRDKQGEV